MDGLYYALLEGRFLFDFVHEDKLAPEDLAKYTALMLPNTALLSDEQCRQLRAYVDAGGSLLATFETSLYNERNERRADFGLADVFGIRKAGDVIGTNGNAYLARIEKPHAILDGLHGHGLDSRRGESRAAGAGGWSGADAWCRASWRIRRSCRIRRSAHTDEPAVVVRQKGQEPAGLFPRRHRADHVAIRPHRPGAAAAELHPLGGGRRIRR